MMRDPLPTVRLPHKERKGLCSPPNGKGGVGFRGDAEREDQISYNRPKFRATWVHLPFLPPGPWSLKKTLRHPQIPLQLLSFPPLRSPASSPTAMNPA